FFQAEDGIRDPLVTGVQTCALPISSRLIVGWRWSEGLHGFAVSLRAPGAVSRREPICQVWIYLQSAALPRQSGEVLLCAVRRAEIGRASCRECGESWGVEG